jgi:integrase
MDQLRLKPVHFSKVTNGNVKGLPKLACRAQLVLEIRERLIFRSALCEGMRPGEILGLKVGDFHEGMVHVERRIYRGKVDVPESRRSRRPISPTETRRGLLSQWLTLLQDRSLSAWLFPSENAAMPLSYSNVYRRRIRPALSGVGLGNVNFQVLRRTWVTEFSEAERNPNVRRAACRPQRGRA